jgi:hypothetical protein
LLRPDGDQPVRRLRDVGEGHSTHDSRPGGEHLGQPDFLIVTQMEIGGAQ